MACAALGRGAAAMATVEYVQESADDYKLIKQITLPGADAAQYYMTYLASLGVNSWLARG
jgi:hypothetical protein